MDSSPSLSLSASSHRKPTSDTTKINEQPAMGSPQPQIAGDILIDDFTTQDTWDERWIREESPSRLPVLEPPSLPRVDTGYKQDDLPLVHREHDEAMTISKVDNEPEEKAATKTASKVHTPSPSSSVPSTPRGFESVECMIKATSPRTPLAKGAEPPPPVKKKMETGDNARQNIPLEFMSPSVSKRTPPGVVYSQEPPPVSRIPSSRPQQQAVTPSIAEVMSPLPTRESSLSPTPITSATSTKLEPLSNLAWSSPVPLLTGSTRHSPPSNDELAQGSSKRQDSFSDIQKGSTTVKTLIDNFNVKTVQPGEIMGLLRKIQLSLPDVGRLMTHYEEAQDKLTFQQIALKEMEAKHEQFRLEQEYQHEQALMQKNFQTEKLQQENDMLKETLLANRAAFQETLDMLKVDIETLEASKNTVETRYQYLRQQDETKAAERLEAREAELMAERDSMKHAYETAKKALEESKSNIQANYDNRFNCKQAELEATQSNLMKTIAKLEASLGEKEKKLANNQQELMEMHKQVSAKHCEVHAKHAELLSKQAELQSKHVELTNKHGEAAEWKQKYEHLLQEFEARGRELESARVQLTHAPNLLNEKNNERNKLLEEEIERLRKTMHAKDEIITTLGSDRGVLRKKLDDTSGEVSRQRGLLENWKICLDLHTMVVNFSKENFGHISGSPPSKVIDKIPSSLPPFFDNTASSRELRAAYAQHTVFRILTQRIFTPFLFTADGGEDECNISAFLATLATNISRTSALRGSFWRQQTLKAAFGAPGAGALANEIAFRTVKDIVDELRYFSDSTQTDSICTGARGIVKLALETWRFARVERLDIVAEIPPVEDQVNEQDYQEFDFVHGSVDPAKNENTNTRQLLLRTAPRIYREPAYEDILNDVTVEHAQKLRRKFVYLAGTNLYKDSTVVSSRRQAISQSQ
ncbi:hypothetical protein KEM54_003554 [Ascosphaera aggregata]|nr:hypothetical protein KEM54_003554 [Ascosphaera aggregata]